MLPTLPPKTTWHGISDEFIRERATKLDIYLQQLCVLPGASLLPFVRSFVNESDFDLDAEPSGVQAMGGGNLTLDEDEGEESLNSEIASEMSSLSLVPLTPPQLHMLEATPLSTKYLNHSQGSGDHIETKSNNLTIEHLDQVEATCTCSASLDDFRTPPRRGAPTERKLLETPPKSQGGNTRGLSFENIFPFEMERQGRSNSFSSATGSLGGLLPCATGSQGSPCISPSIEPKTSSNLKPYFSHHNSSGNLLVF